MFDCTCHTCISQCLLLIHRIGRVTCGTCSSVPIQLCSSPAGYAVLFSPSSLALLTQWLTLSTTGIWHSRPPQIVLMTQCLCVYVLCRCVFVYVCLYVCVYVHMHALSLCACVCACSVRFRVLSLGAKVACSSSLGFDAFHESRTFVFEAELSHTYI